MRRPDFRQLKKNYRLPFNATVLFVLIVAALLLLRLRDQSIVAGLAAGNNSSGESYAVLLSEDKLDGPKSNESAENTSQTEVATISPQQTGTFTVSPDGGSSSSGEDTDDPPSGNSGEGSTTPPPTQPFSATIANFRFEGASAVNCDGSTAPPPTGGSYPPNCYKMYYFSASVRSMNGPGAVTYHWQSNIATAIGDGNFLAPAGETFTPLPKQVKMYCGQSGTILLQLMLISPTAQQSNTINITHSC